jgi:hypothetical protein
MVGSYNIGMHNQYMYTRNSGFNFWRMRRLKIIDGIISDHTLPILSL